MQRITLFSSRKPSGHCNHNEKNHLSPWTPLGRPLDAPWTPLGRPLDAPWTPLGRPLDERSRSDFFRVSSFRPRLSAKLPGSCFEIGLSQILISGGLLWIEEFWKRYTLYANPYPPPCNLQAISELDENEVKDGLLLERLARTVNLSPSRLRALIKAETGLTLKQHLKQLRLEKAMKMVETTYLTINQILVEVGVNDPSHFLKDFKRAYGVTPTEYRKRQAKGKPDTEQLNRPINNQNGQ